MIDPEHLAALAESGITSEFAMARGYETITDKRRLAELKITTAGRNIPGLLIPLLRAEGSTWGYQYRPDAPRCDSNGRPRKYETPYGQRNGLDIPPGVAALLGDPAVPLFITEGVKKGDAGALNGLCIVDLIGVWNWLYTNTAGGKMALPEWRDCALNGRRVIPAFDSDMARNDQVQKAVRGLAGYLATKGARIEYLWLPDTDNKTGLDDYLAEHTVDELMRLVKPTLPPVTQPRDATPQDRQPAEPKPEPVQPVSLDRLHERFLYWFGDHYDLDAINATLAAAAVERLDGDPLWLLIISGPGATKTETVITLKGLDDKTRVVSTISSVGALLSATAKKERSQDATGGLLKELEPRGIMIIKDLTSILSMQSAVRGPILSALREVYDGYYVRDAGVDGGTKIPWEGRIVIIGAVTTAWDAAHEVIAEMGDRFALLRVDSTDNRRDRTNRAVNNTGTETEMRDELSRLARGVIAGIDPASAPTLTKEERDAIVAAADVATLARTSVMRDGRGDVIDAHAPELGTRFAKQLTQVFRGAVVIGLDRGEALRLAIRVARDSMPPLRLAIIDDLSTHPHSTPTDVRRRLGKPRTTVDRQLQALHILGIVELDERDELGPYGKLLTRLVLHPGQ